MRLLRPIGLALGLALAGCGDKPTEPAATEAASQAVAAPLVEKAWQARMADAATRAPYEGHAGWGALFMRNHDEALAAFAADPGDGRGLARLHLEMAIVYREAARLAANATLQVYEADRQPEDPPETTYLVAVSKALLGDVAGAKAALAALPAGSAVAAHAAAWQGWLDGGATWPPDAALTGFPGQPGEVLPGTVPPVGDLPHYLFKEQGAEGREVRATDPTTMYLVSRWHEAAARKAAPTDDALITALLAPWRLKPEAAPPEAAPADVALDVPDAWLFASFALAPEDVGFLAAASSQGVAAVSAWQDRSPLAAAVAPAIEGGQVMPDKMLDQAAWLGAQVEDAMTKRAGQVEAFHRPFADLARAAALRAGMIVADSNGQTRDAGILRINALDRSVESAADPLFFVSVAAWDVGNRNPLRAQDLLHGLLSRFPGVEVSRYPLDAMHVRLGRNAAPATPVF